MFLNARAQEIDCRCGSSGYPLDPVAGSVVLWEKAWDVLDLNEGFNEPYAVNSLCKVGFSFYN